MITEVKLPELGENIDSAEVLSILVQPGTWVEKDQPVMELETDKATAEVPADTAGVVVDVKVKEGDEVRVGQTIFTLETQGDGGAGKTASAAAAPHAEAPHAEAPAPATETPVGASKAPAAAKTPAATGTPGPAKAPARGKKTSAPAEPRESQGNGSAGRAEAAPPEPSTPAEPPEKKAPGFSLVDHHRDETTDLAEALPEVAPAAPSVRRLARELGIDVNMVPGTAPGGRISEDDVKTYARRLIVQSGIAPMPPVPAVPSVPAGEVPELPDFSPWGEVEREPASKVRRVTAQAMSLSWNVIPHVTQYDRADVTDLEAWRRRQASRVEAAGGKLTVTSIVTKVLASALRVFPKLNASFDARNEEIVTKKYVNVGVAVDTDFGLLVPVIKNADAKNIARIAVELTDLAARARARKIAAEELQGGNINLSNLGGLGTTYFSPIIQWPHVAVLGVGRATVEATWRDGAFVPRSILPLSVSYDHRLIDGADAARFLRWIAEALEEPMLLALEG